MNQQIRCIIIALAALMLACFPVKAIDHPGISGSAGSPEEVIENLQELEDDGEIYETIEDIWPDYPTKDNFFFNEEEY